MNSGNHPSSIGEATPVDDHVPVIDISALFLDDPHGHRAVADAIHRAATGIGFFYVKGHPIPRDLLDAVQLAAKYIFSLPDAVKQSIRVTKETAHRGYMPPAQTLQPGRRRPDNKESFNLGFPFTPDHPAMQDGHPLVGLNQWPPGETLVREVLERYYQSVLHLGRHLLGGVALSLGIERDYFASCYRYPLARTRIFRYPALTTEAGEDIPGAASHTDYGALTLLWQDDVGGLQIRSRGGQWIDAPYIDGTFVINIGDMLQRWSNDIFVSNPHRVINDSGRERLSIATFYDPDHDASVSCLPNCASATNPPRHEPVLAGQYLLERLNGTYAYRQPALSWQ